MHVVSSGPSQKPGLDTGGVEHHWLPMVREPRLVRDLWSFVLWLKILLRLEPNVVVIGTPKAAILGLVAARLAGTPFRVYHLRGLRMEASSGLKRGFLRFAERLTARAATHIVAVSTSLAQEYLAENLAPPAKVSVLGCGSSHGVDTRQFFPLSPAAMARDKARLALSANVPVLGFVGRFSADKGADAILATRRWLVREGTDHELLIVGAIEDSEQIFRQLSLVGRPVKHVEWTDQVASYYRLMDLLLLPSRREGFPNVVLEAAATGVPSIVTATTGSVDAIVHGQTGLVVETGSIEKFAVATSDLLGERDLRLKMGEKALARVRAFYRSEIVEHDFASFIQALRHTNA